MSIDRPGGVAEIFGYYGLAAILVFVTLWVLDKLSPPRLRLWRWLSALSIVLASWLLSGSFLVPEGEARTEISGKAADPSLACYLFVRPIGSPRCWLQSPVPLILSSDGTWRTQAWLAGPSGQRFELLVVGSAEALHPEILDQPGSYECRVIPEKSSRTAILVELR